MEVFERKIVDVTSRENVVPGIKVTATDVFNVITEARFSPLSYYLGTRGYEIINEEFAGRTIIEIDFSIFPSSSSVFRLEGFDYLKITNYHGSYKGLNEVFSFDLTQLSVGFSNCSLFFNSSKSALIPRNFIFDSSVSVFDRSSLEKLICVEGEDFHTAWKMMDDPDILTRLSQITGLTNNDLHRLARVKSMALD